MNNMMNRQLCLFLLLSFEIGTISSWSYHRGLKVGRSASTGRSGGRYSMIKAGVLASRGGIDGKRQNSRPRTSLSSPHGMVIRTDHLYNCHNVKRLHSTECKVASSLSVDVNFLRQPHITRLPSAVLDDKNEGAQKGSRHSRVSTLFQNMDTVAFLAYLSNIVTVCLPVILLPAAASELIAMGATAASISAGIAGMTAVASLGGAAGKFVNGFVVSHSPLSPHACSLYYLMGLAACSWMFSFSKTMSSMSYSLAGMEFFASMQWTALAVMLGAGSDNKKFAKSMTKLGLSSTTGQIFSKLFAPTLLCMASWRTAARVGSCVAILGAMVVLSSKKQVHTSQITHERAARRSALSSISSIMTSFRDVLGAPIFWVVGLAHAAAYLARSSDRILGAFLQEVTTLSHSMCGGLTLSITLGLVFGLMRGDKNFTAEKDDGHKSKFLKRCYIASVISALGLAGLAQYGLKLISSSLIMALLVGVSSFVMASGLSFQYFQLPSMVARRFGNNKAVCISFLDGIGFLLAAPVFATTSKLVPLLGWSSAWIMLAGIFGIGGVLMLKALENVMTEQ